MKKTLQGIMCQWLTPLLRTKLNRPMIATLLVICSLNLQARDTIERDVQNMIVLSAESASIKEVLETLESQTDFRFFYNHKAMSDSEKVTLSLNNVSLESALRELANQAHLVFKIRGDQIVVRKKPAAPVISLFARSQPSITEADLNRMTALSKRVVVVDQTVSG